MLSLRSLLSRLDCSRPAGLVVLLVATWIVVCVTGCTQGSHQWFEKANPPSIALRASVPACLGMPVGTASRSSCSFGEPSQRPLGVCLFRKNQEKSTLREPQTA